MLESNTDRSYFMIGAVIVAAVIIAGALWLFRDVIFGNNGFIFKLVNNVFGQASTLVNGIPASQHVPTINLFGGLF